ncbi:MAG: M20 family metallopeptidase [Firmicutes bacterium]|nr:M20 family metallopeptidase [Bacillota bacterium]MCL5039151.1 M20 family metallopeptidase [Bacillota bacterium]
MSSPVSYFETRLPKMVDLLRELVERESPSTNKEKTDEFSNFLRQVLQKTGARVETIEQEKYGNFLRAVIDPGDAYPAETNLADDSGLIEGDPNHTDRLGENQASGYGEPTENLVRPSNRLEDGRDRDLPGKDKGQVLLLAHMDTVWEVGEIAKRPFRAEGNRAFGPGAYDMKGGIVQIVFAFQALRELGLRTRRRIVALFNTDEEIGSPGSRPFIEAEARRSDYVLVLEPSVPPAGVLKTSRKGVGRFDLRITGRAAHAGSDHEKGISAIQELAHQILRLHSLTDYSRGTTVNVGVIKGGTRSNVVAAEAEAGIDLRVVTREEGERVVKEILSLKPHAPGLTLLVAGGLNRPPMERSAGTVALFQRALALGKKLGLEVQEASSGGGSDGNFTADLGVPTLDGLGPVGDGAHAEDEYLLVDQLPKRTTLLLKLLDV